MPFRLAPELTDIVRPGLLWLEGATVVDRDPRLDAVLAAAEASVRADPPGTFRPQDSPGSFRPQDSPGSFRLQDFPGSFRLQPEEVRKMYKRVGIDPTKTRPSSEALLRRVRKGDALPRINSMVDVCNWCSLEFQLPYGLYDLAHVEGDVIEMRRGRDGESYAGIRKDEVHVGGRICLSDARGPFGNPTSDSARTMVTKATTRALVVVFAPRSLDSRQLDRVLDATAQRMGEFTGASITERLGG